MTVVTNNQLIYDARPGQHIDEALQVVLDRKYAGCVFNGMIVRRSDEKTVEELRKKYEELCSKGKSK